MQYLLLTNSRLPCVTSEIAAGVEDKNVPEESLLIEWKTAIEHYFKSVVSVLFLQQICLNPHKDITLEQVKYLFLNIGTVRTCTEFKMIISDDNLFICD